VPPVIIGGHKDTAIPGEPTSNPDTLRSEPEGKRIVGLGGLLIELLLPVSLSAVLLLALVAYTPRWDLHAPVGLAIFGVLLGVLSLFLSLRLDTLTRGRRRRDGKRRLLNRPGPQWRLAKLVLGGVVIPILALSAANLVELSDHQTPMTLASLAVRSRLGRHELDWTGPLGDAVLRSRSPSAKVQGILALQALATGQALDQLFRILHDDPTVLGETRESEAMSAALASYGVPARTKLLRLLADVPPGDRKDARAPSGDPLARELADAPPSRAPEAREGTAQAELVLPSFVMQTFLTMASNEDAELLVFARQTAADSTWSDPVRGQALQLIAKLGGKDDLDGLYGYLENPSALLQANAMRAIATLQARLTASAAKR
jgi:hypothetical protein